MCHGGWECLAVGWVGNAFWSCENDLGLDSNMYIVVYWVYISSIEPWLYGLH